MFFSPSAYVHPYEVCRRRRPRAATVVRSCVAVDERVDPLVLGRRRQNK